MQPLLRHAGQPAIRDWFNIAKNGIGNVPPMAASSPPTRRQPCGFVRMAVNCSKPKRLIQGSKGRYGQAAAGTRHCCAEPQSRGSPKKQARFGGLLIVATTLAAITGSIVFAGLGSSDADGGARDRIRTCSWALCAGRWT
ncbi:MAG: hypothetical protein JWM36_2693 [Hyphomicrobiales bacterium]|nr:hypothetical protein [Hyphomicrobiales bacterium]